MSTRGRSEPRRDLAERSRLLGRLSQQCILGRIANQAARITHLVHHLIATVDARGATDALVLQSFADIDSDRADLDADRAIDAIAEAGRSMVDLAAARAARLAAQRVVGDDQRIGVEHHALKSGVRTHVLADLLAQITGIAVRRACIEQYPERLPCT